MPLWRATPFRWDEFYVRAALAKSIWDACKIPYSWFTEGDGFGYGVLDRETFVVCSTIDTRADPDSDYAFWNKLVGTGQLIDAATGAPFPYPVPRSAFLAVRDEAWAKAIERLVNDFSSSLVVKHHSYHLRFEKLYTNTGQVPCQTCLRGINGTRHRCKTCFDWSECACHDQRVERWSNYAVIGMKSFAGGWNLGMQLDGL
ncbi:hypothetical protein DL93DRAFT_2087476 [Clavulina sp. PMI_390]|nr:hypothetical protein DL93DRAFT_2087476 [Clavulina sp. PMI_390]